jgi:hypothetical protein
MQVYNVFNREQTNLSFESKEKSICYSQILLFSNRSLCRNKLHFLSKNKKKVKVPPLLSINKGKVMDCYMFQLRREYFSSRKRCRHYNGCGIMIATFLFCKYLRSDQSYSIDSFFKRCAVKSSTKL